MYFQILKKLSRRAFLRDNSGYLFQIRDLKFGFRRVSRNTVDLFPRCTEDRPDFRTAKKTQSPDSHSQPFRPAQPPAVRREIPNSLAIAGIEENALEPSLSALVEFGIMAQDLGK